MTEDYKRGYADGYYFGDLAKKPMTVKDQDDYAKGFEQGEFDYHHGISFNDEPHENSH